MIRIGSKMFLWNCLLLIPMILANEVKVQISKNYYARIDNTTRRNILYDIKAIDPSIPENPSEELDLSNRMLTVINVKAFDNVRHVKSLNLSNNPLTMIWKNTFANMKTLENLDLSNCNISLIIKRFKGLGNLKVLNLTYNRITNLPESAFIGLTKSCVIWLGGNNISSMSTKLYEVVSSTVNPFQLNQTEPFELKKNITICFNDTKLISVEKYTGSEELPRGCSPDDESYSEGILNLSGMNITEFQKGWYKLGDLPVHEIDLSVNMISRLTNDTLNDLPESISSVDLSNNEMEFLDKGIIVNKHLRKMNFTSNSIHRIEDDVFVNTNLKTLTLSNNSLSDTTFAATFPPTLTEISLDKNFITKISRESFKSLLALEVLNLHKNQIHELDSGVFANTNLTTLTLSRNMLKDMTFVATLPPTLREISLHSNLISTISRESFKSLLALEVLNLRENLIRELDSGVFVNTNLKTLTLSNNSLGDTTFAATLPPTLTEISLDINFISTIPRESFKSLLALKVLDLRENLITELDSGVFVNTNLTNLILSDNDLRDTKFVATLPPTLTKISLDHNKISKISRQSFKRSSNLEFLDLGANKLTKLDLGEFADLKNIREIWLDGNKMQSLWRNSSINLPDTLEVLHLENNLLVNLKAGTFVNSPTYELLLNNNTISNIEDGSFNLPHLRNLDLSSNSLSVIESGMLQGLTNLQNLSLEGNNIAAIREGTFKNFESLCKLVRSVNPIDRLKNGTLQRLVPKEGCDVVIVDVPIEMIQGDVFTTILDSSSDRKQIFSLLIMIVLIHLI